MSRRKAARKKRSSAPKRTTAPADIPGMLKDAVGRHQRGDRDGAEALYRAVLDRDPRHPDALHLLGLLSHQRGRHDRCAELIGRALEVSPGNPVFLFNLGVAQAEMGRKDDAVATYRAVLDRDPAHVQALFNLGNLHRDRESHAEAETCYREALRHRPDYGKARLNLGTLFQTQGRLDEAAAEFEKARELRPESAGPHFRLGSLHRARGRFPDALAAYRQALACDPGLAKAHNNIGNIHQDLGEYAQAREAYERAIETDPDYAIARFNLANLRQLDGELDAAAAEYRRILEADPDHVDARINLGHAFKRKGAVDAAIDAFRQSLETQPENAQALAALAHQLQYACEWAELERVQPRLDAVTDRNFRDGVVPAESPFENLTRHEDPARNLAVARMHAAQIRRSAERMDVRFDFAGRREKDGPIVVGYVSHDFGNHPVAHLIQALFGAHDRERFRVNAYSIGPDDGTSYRRRVEADADRFLDIRGMGHPEAARAIHADGVDILVDLMGHTLHSRLEIFALRPAPVQVAFLGYPGSTGAAFMDYIVADRTVVPPEHAGHFTERLLYLPHAYQVNDGAQPIGEPPPDRAAAGLPGEGFVYCSFNQSYKIVPAVFDRWMNLLKGTSGSVLWLLQGNSTATTNLRRAAEARGVSPDRLIFAERAGKPDHLARQRLADLALDTFPVNGHTTTSDILWSGVPVVALKGRHFASRVSASLLDAVGLPELVVEDLDAYEALALRLAREPDDLTALRERLARNRTTFPLFDTARFARNLERAFEAVWEDWRTERPPRALEIPDAADANAEVSTLPLQPASAESGEPGAAGTGETLREAQKLLLRARERQRSGDAAAALALYERVLALHPESIAALGNMGAVYHGMGRLDDAEERYRRVLEIKPDSHEAYNNLGNVYESRGNSAEAVRCYKKAVEIAPQFAEGFNNLGLAYKSSGKNDKAMDAYEQAIAVNPDMDRAYNGVVYLFQQFCMWEKVTETGAALDRLTEQALAEGRRPAESPFTSLTRTGDLRRNLSIAESWSREIARRMRGSGRRFDLGDRNVSREKLTVGYLSNDFYNHATAHLMLGLFGRHDRERFRIHCYSYGKKDTSIYSRRIREDCDRFVDVAGMSHEEAARRIYEDEVDILLELKGFTKDNRLEIPALRPAPVQVEWLGFPCTTGAEFIDYVITDRIITPEAHLPFYSEQPVYLPHTYQINDDRQPIADRAFSRSEFDLPEDAFVFCSFNQAYKFTPEIFDIWMRLLDGTPGSVLWLLPRSKAAENRIREEAERRSVDPARIVCSAPMAKDAHLARHRLADLGLDTYIVNGHTTTSDALWAGLPVVSLMGPHFASRVSASLLHAVGLPELVADDLPGYEALALRLAGNPDELASIRARLLENRCAYPLFDTARFARNLERAFEAMWRRFREGKAPAPISVRDEDGPRPFDALPLPDIQEVHLVPGDVSAFAAAFPVVEAVAPAGGAGGARPAPAAPQVDDAREAAGARRDDPPAPVPPESAEPPGSPAGPDPDAREDVSSSDADDRPLERGRNHLARGEWQAAIDWFEKAVKVSEAETADACAGLGRAWLEAGNPEKAVFFAQRTTAFHPFHAEAFRIQAVGFHRLGNAEAGRDAFERAIRFDPALEDELRRELDAPVAPPSEESPKPAAAAAGNKAPAGEKAGGAVIELNLPDALKRGVGFHQAGKLDQAEAIYRKILDVAPAHPDALHLLGVAAYQRKKPEAAVELIRKAIAEAPRMPVFHSNLGAALQLKGDMDAALRAYETALELDPNHVEAWFNGGNLHKTLGDYDASRRYFSRALELRPAYAEAMNGMGMVFRKTGDEAEARKWFERAVERKPEFAEARYNLATSPGLSQEAAIEGLRETLEADPGHPKAYAGLVHRLYHVCDWGEVERLGPALDEITDRQMKNGEKTAEQPLMNLVRSADPARNLAVARSWAENARRLAPASGLDFSFDRFPDAPAKIRVGYLSNDFRNHPVAHLIQRLFGLHDRSDFEIHAYSFGKDDGSEYRKVIAEGCDRFVDIRELSLADAARRIHMDGIHILVDLMGHTGGENRMEICALRPAPVVCTWLGYPGSAGADFIDYILVDRTVAPESHRKWFTEQPVYLPHAYQVNDNRQTISDRAFTRADQGLPETGFVFASFNQVYKIDPETFSVWMRLVSAVEGSVLWLFATDPLARTHLRREAESRGVDPDRLVFADRLPKAEHLARQRLADLGLDTRWVNGHTTTSDALWSGLPVVTLEGTNFASRVAASLLRAVEMPELVTNSLADYEALALELARDGEKRAAVRRKLAEKRETAPLFDTERFARNLERGFREMWRLYRSGESPRTVVVEETDSDSSGIDILRSDEFSIWQVQIPGYVHSHAFDEVALGLCAGFRRLGVSAPVVHRMEEMRGRGVVLGCNFLPKIKVPYERLPDDLILFNLEQVYRTSPWITDDYLDLLKRYVVWDYSEKNIRAWREMGLERVIRCGIGYEPELQRIPDAPEPDIDVLFYGSVNARRKKALKAMKAAGLVVKTLFGVYGEARDRDIARSKIVLNLHFYDAQVFEIVRVSYLLANRRFVVSEIGADGWGKEMFGEGIAFSTYDDLVETCVRYAGDPEARAEIARLGFERMREFRQSDFLEQAIREL